MSKVRGHGLGLDQGLDLNSRPWALPTVLGEDLQRNMTRVRQGYGSCCSPKNIVGCNVSRTEALLISLLIQCLILPF